MNESDRGLALAEYQRRAQETDHLPKRVAEGMDPRLPPLLGLAGEIGTLITGYKKFLRDGSAYELFRANVKEELGDILWYLANAAHKFDISLEEIAEYNLQKTSDRWPLGSNTIRPKRDPTDHFDAEYDVSEQLPRTFDITIRPIEDPERPEPMIEVLWQGKRVGSKLGDNTYEDSGYRFHDAFHLANAAVLGWSPVARGVIFKRKRKSNPTIDAVEDGGRAIINEEAFVALMFAYAGQHNYLAGVRRLDYGLLKTFRTFTADLEVTARYLWEVEEAVLQGFEVWRKLRQNRGGVIHGDLSNRTLTYLGPPAKALAKAIE